MANKVICFWLEPPLLQNQDKVYSGLEIRAPFALLVPMAEIVDLCEPIVSYRLIGGRRVQP